jgi:dTDP-4-amino-4,6-dideoxygalactose transaminase
MHTTPQIQLNDFTAQWFEHRVRYTAAFERVGASGWLILGREVELFEEQLAKHLGLPYAVGMGNGLDALEIALRCCGVQPGDLVLTTYAFTGGSTGIAKYDLS